MNESEKVAAWRRSARQDPNGFWARAAEQLPWTQRWEKVLDWQPPTFRWFVGGRTNLARNRIGAVMLVVFAGFGSGALGERLRLAGARAVFASDLTYRKRKDVPLKGIVDDAVAGCPTVERVVVLRRSQATPMAAGRDLTWEDFLDPGDLSTIEDEGSVEEAREAWEQMTASVTARG